jgi:hypothetical protein
MGMNIIVPMYGIRRLRVQTAKLTVLIEKAHDFMVDLHEGNNEQGPPESHNFVVLCDWIYCRVIHVYDMHFYGWMNTRAMDVQQLAGIWYGAVVSFIINQEPRPRRVPFIDHHKFGERKKNTKASSRR